MGTNVGKKHDEILKNDSQKLGGSGKQCKKLIKISCSLVIKKSKYQNRKIKRKKNVEKKTNKRSWNNLKKQGN